MMPTLVLDAKTANAIIAILVIVFVILAILSVGFILQMSSRPGDVNDEEDEEDISKRICCVCLCPPNPNDAPRLSSRIS